MKTKLLSISKRTIAVFLGVLMIVTSIGLTASAYYWSGGTYYMKGSFNNWGNLSGTNNSNNTKQHYYYIYAPGSASNADITFKFKEEDNGDENKKYFGAGDTDSIGTTGKQIWADGGENIHLNRKNLGTTSTTWYKLKIWFEHASNCYCWYEKDTTKTAMVATLTTKKGSTSTTTFTAGDTVSLSTSTTNLFGTASYTYRYKIGNGSWNNISGSNFVPNTAGTYTIEVTANDGAVVSGTNSESARTTTATKEITVNPSETMYTITTKKNVNGTTTNISTNQQVGSNVGTDLSFNPYETANNVRYKLVSFSSSNNVTLSNPDYATGAVHAVASSGTNAYVTANYTQEADFNQFYFKKPSNWTNVYAYLWDSSTENSGTVKNHDYGGIQIPDAAYGPASGARTDTYGTLDYVGTLSIKNGSNTDKYYYYKTYYTAYDRLIFNNNQSTTDKTSDLYIDDTNIQNNTASGYTYTKNSMYYNKDDGKWYPLPAALYNVTINATGNVTTKANSTGASTATGTVSSSSAAVNSSTKVDVTITAPSGYTFNSTTPVSTTGGAVATLKTNTSTTQKTYTISATADGTVTPNFVETSHTITIKQRTYDRNNTLKATTTLTTVNAGISSYATVAAAAGVTDYTFAEFELANGVTLNTGSLSTSAAITVKAKTSGTYEVYKDYTETLNTLTIQRNNDSYGVVKKDNTGSGLTSYNVGNVTYISFTAVNNSGYDFSHWEITPASGTTVTVQKYDGTGTTTITSDTGSDKPSSGNIRLNATLKFKINGAATIKAHFTAVAYSITAAWDTTYGNYSDSNSLSVTDTSGNTKGSGNVGDTFEIRINIADGYELDGAPTFSTASGYAAPTLVSGYPITSGTLTKYRYTLNAGKVAATVKLKAKTPTVTAFSVNQKTADNTFSYKNVLASNSYADLFYKQDVSVKATISSYSTTKANLSVTKLSTTYATATEKTSANLNPGPVTMSAALPGADTTTGYVAYTLSMDVTNAPAGVQSITVSKTCELRVYYNSAQKAYLKMKNLYNNTVAEDSTSASTYYNSNAPYSAFNSQRGTVSTNYTTSGTWNKWPDYNSSSSTTTTIQTAYNNFFEEYKNLQSAAKKTTVYVLSRFPKTDNDTNVVSIYNTSNGNTADFEHFKQYHYFLDPVYNSEVTPNVYSKGENELQHHIMRYEGRVSNSALTDSGTKYYLYSFTYAGHVNAQIYVAGSKTDITVIGNTITGTVASVTGTNVGMTEFKDYYINANNVTSKGATGITTASYYVDLNIKRDSTGKVPVKNGMTLTRAQIMGDDYLKLAVKSSLKDNDPNISTTISKFTVNGTSLDSDSSTYEFNTPGKQIIKVQTKYTYGEKADRGSATFETAEKTFYLYVTYSKIDVYVDMNDNVGNPSLNFTYSDGGSSKNLPFDMTLVTGSESIYKVNIDLNKLKSDYNISYTNENDIPQNITINSIKVDNVSKGSYTIKTDAYLSGSAWFKANSTSLTRFIPISYSNVKTTFRAVDTSGAYLKDAISSVNSNGIITDEYDGIFDVFYAGIDEAADYSFSYNAKARAQQMFKDGNTTYYFEGWYKTNGIDEVETTTVNDETTVSSLSMTGDLSGAYISEKSDYNILSAPVADDGDYTYVAVYKSHTAVTNNARVKITYNFKDYDTDDGNYAFDETTDNDGNYTKVKDASYTKVVKTDKTFTYLTTKTNNKYERLDALAEGKMPQINSNYFDYDYKTDSVVYDEDNSDEASNLVVINVTLTESAHPYKIKVVDSSNNVINNLTQTGYYMQPVTIAAPSSISNPVWKAKYATLNNTDQEQVIATGRELKTRFTASGFDTNDGDDCQIIKVINDSNASVTNKTVITNSTTEIFYDGDTEKVKHNFYINDYCGKGKLIGGGVLYATIDSNGNYRQQSAGTNLASANSMQAYINRVLVGIYSKEYKAQTIENTGFRYLPYVGNEEVYRYSDLAKAYLYTFTANNTNSVTYNGQKLRVFSFMVYDNNGTPTIVPSEYYAEVSRYVDTTS